MEKILLIEDGPEFQLMVRAALENKYRLEVAGTLAQGREKLAKEQFDLMVLDVMLPDGEGFGLCEEVRKGERNRYVPIVFLSSRGEITDKLHGFALGADDYIVKPFDALELRARIEAKLVRMREKPRAEDTYVKGAIRLEVATGRAFLSEGEGKKADMALTPIEFKILYHLARNEHKVISREELLTTVWGEGTHVFDRATDKHVSSLRQKLGNQSKCIETVSRVGYRFATQGKS